MTSISSTIKVAPQQENKLLKILGLGFGLAIVIGSTLGLGILRTPGIVAAGLGSMTLILAVWTLGGIYALIGANTFSELATMLPKAGGGYVYIRRAYGDFFGFAGGMSDFILNCCAAAYIAVALGEYSARLFPYLAGRENLVGAGVLLGLFAVHRIGLRAGDLAQQLTSFVKVVAFLILIVASFILGGRENTGIPKAIPVSGDVFAVLAALAISMQAVMETYAGWNSVVYFSEENKDATRNVPRSLFGGVLIVMTIYILINAAYLYALPLDTLAHSKLPAADAAEAIFGAAGSKIITALAICSILGALNAMVLYTPRTLFAMSRDGYLPFRVSNVSASGTPVMALVATIGLMTIFELSGSFETLLAIAAFLSLANDSFCYLSIFVLRRREPDLPRPYRAIGYPVLPAIVLIGAWTLLIVYLAGNTMNSLYSIGILVLLYPAFLILKRLSKI